MLLADAGLHRYSFGFRANIEDISENILDWLTI